MKKKRTSSSAVYLRRTECDGAEGREGGEQLGGREGLQEGGPQQRQEGGQLGQARWREGGGAL